MIKNENKLDVDIKKRLSAIHPIYVNQDTASIVFRIFDNGEPLNLNPFNRARIRLQLKNKEVIEFEGTINTSNQTVSYFLDDATMSTIGDLTAILSLYAEGIRVSVLPFKIRIVKNKKLEMVD